VLAQGTLSFSIESRVLRELGERLVKQPSVAVVELVKNAYDADATECEIAYEPRSAITVKDDGVGMSLDQFIEGWMRIGTSSKEGTAATERFGRLITGEKGIGRFAVRFLGQTLHLETIANDPERGRRTRLIAKFDWPEFDKHEDLGRVKVPYTLEAVASNTSTGTTLVIADLRSQTSRLDLQSVRSGSIGVLTPLRSLLREMSGKRPSRQAKGADPGFLLKIQMGDEREEVDVAATVLDNFVLRASLRLEGNKLDLKVFRRGESEPALSIVDTYKNEVTKLYADIRFFPRRKGVFTDATVDGRIAYGWITQNSGVAVFDRDFRVQPYGAPVDDWLQLAADAARNRREPRSSVSQKHFPMSSEVRSSTSENWMLRLPQSAQLVGVVQVEGRRARTGAANEDTGLIASADREGFVANMAFDQLQDLVRGAVEAIASEDRRLQQELVEAERVARIALIRTETKEAVREITANPNIATADKTRIIATLVETQELAERQDESARERERQLEVMSLLGVVAGFMTHEFGGAFQELESAHKELVQLAKANSVFAEAESRLATHIKALREYVTYSTGYIAGSKKVPTERYMVKPRIRQVVRIYGQYAEERRIDVEVGVEADLLAPLVPVSLYNGIALNLYTNALKAITAKTGKAARTIAFRAWNDDQLHYLEVSDTGIGIPSALRRHVFDPLFTTTESRRDPLGSGMGLGMSLVRRGAEAFGGHVDLVDPPPNFATCVRVRIPLEPHVP
jgi:signal transduction histidine kinase